MPFRFRKITLLPADFGHREKVIPCPYDQKKFPDQLGLYRHLRDKHGLSQDEAQEVSGHQLKGK